MEAWPETPPSPPSPAKRATQDCIDCPSQQTLCGEWRTSSPRPAKRLPPAEFAVRAWNGLYVRECSPNVHACTGFACMGHITKLRAAPPLLGRRAPWQCVCVPMAGSSTRCTQCCKMRALPMPEALALGGPLRSGPGRTCLCLETVQHVEGPLSGGSDSIQ